MFQTPPSTTFPDVTGTALDGTEHALPDDFDAPWNLLVVTFRDDLDRLADKWVLVAERIASNAEGRLAAYELPVVGRGFKPFKRLVNASIGAKADADEAEKARTIPLYVGKSFQKDLGLKDEDTVHVLLVSRNGRIAWRDQGLLTPDKVAALEEAVGETITDRAPDEGPPQPRPELRDGELEDGA
ncbi:MAG: hypothetical protein R3181_10435 [Rubricoccaceae bacterium]|nr:hypothetical protein [Rubricoccaceae bacterium]